MAKKTTQQKPTAAPPKKGTAPAEAPKRGRGRPRKSSVIPAPLPQDASPGKAFLSAFAAPAEPPKRKRGRPPKPKPPEPFPPPPKRKRGRPRKNPLPAAMPAPQPAATVPVAAPVSPSLAPPNFTRLRLDEMTAALHAELAAFAHSADAILLKAREEVAAAAASAAKAVAEERSALSAHDDIRTRKLNSIVEKLARRLAEFRADADPGLEGLAKMAKRLRRAARKVRG